MQNRVYVCMDGWYVCPLNAHAGAFSPKNTGFLSLTSLSSDTTALNNSYLKLQIVR